MMMVLKKKKKANKEEGRREGGNDKYVSKYSLIYKNSVIFTIN